MNFVVVPKTIIMRRSLMKCYLTRFLCAIGAAAFAVFTVSAVQAQPVTVSIGNLTAASGETICIPITIENVGSNIITAFEMSVNYDPDLVEPVAPFYSIAGCLPNGWSVYPNSTGPAGTFSI
ncbi:MAG: hypothetical protein E4G91_10950, partial [Candidatus Zixiibacteriota bacterium]